MIHVQIACQVTTTGVEGVRWALLDSGQAGDAQHPPGAASALAAGLTDAAPAIPASAPTGLPRRLIKLLVASLGLGTALWIAQSRFGPPAQRAAPPAAVSAPKAPAPAPAVPGGPGFTLELR